MVANSAVSVSSMTAICVCCCSAFSNLYTLSITPVVATSLAEQQHTSSDDGEDLGQEGNKGKYLFYEGGRHVDGIDSDDSDQQR